ncbi:ROK family protein [Paenibacillus glycanilyticus]|uniref:ROK family protein n=1 Tax=Paenibacillus glycanilyticus TaxID=126569 RepID=UPI00203EBB8F|nr:ROK family protein [Paenibacillus glycanilyticus]MCM3626712.1 ROK family protein [Paenibacillus glycanilyticus]
MTLSLIVAFDVGGTQIKAAALRNGTIAEETAGHYESQADLAAGPMIARFADVFADILRKAGPDAVVEGLGIAFPGPFDYEEGVSLIQGLGKFDSLYGLPVGQLLEEALRADERTNGRLSQHFRIAFENDAALFGLGETSPGGAAEGADRAVCLTIGTGLGSCFLERGRLVKHRHDVPAEGWLYTVPYREGIADDYVSRRGVLQLAGQLNLDAGHLDVKGLAYLADAGDKEALLLFEQFGLRMADILIPSLLRFNPDRIVLGGQISKSAHLFVPAFREAAAKSHLQAEVRVSRDTLSSTLLGVYGLLGLPDENEKN